MDDKTASMDDKTASMDDKTVPMICVFALDGLMSYEKRAPDYSDAPFYLTLNS